MGKSCCMPRLFPIQLLLIFLRFKLLPNVIFHCYRPQTWQFYIVLPALFISGIHKVTRLNLRVVGHLTRPAKALFSTVRDYCLCTGIYLDICGRSNRFLQRNKNRKQETRKNKQETKSVAHLP